MNSNKTTKILFSILIFWSISLYGQADHVYIDIKNALKTPEKVFQLDLRMGDPKKSELKKLGEFKNLQKLNLSLCGLTSFPKSVLNCKDLKYLNLEYNSITKIPEEMSQLSELEELIIGGNKIEALPNAIFELIKLKNLDVLSTKGYLKLPPELQNMKSLEVLHCSASGKEFEDIICKMTWLKEVEVFTSEYISPCLLKPLINIEKFHMVLSLVSKFEKFECSLFELSQMREFSIMYHTCCWPYIQLTEAEIKELELLLPEGCKLKGFCDENTEIKSDIELR
ncbi:MAG: hypothetical protein GQ574_07125 [Crocinitomix sp.]|nr:hypothetical protein [Crocinitomix sp.]